MSHTTSIRRAASVAGATGLVVLSLAGPASAKPDPGTGTLPKADCSTSSCYQGQPRSGDSQTVTVFRNIDDNAVEVLQLGAGILAGVALAGAGMALASRRTHAAHPA